VKGGAERLNWESLAGKLKPNFKIRLPVQRNPFMVATAFKVLFSGAFRRVPSESHLEYRTRCLYSTVLVRGCAVGHSLRYLIR